MFVGTCKCVQICNCKEKQRKKEINNTEEIKYEGESISNQSNLFPVEIHLFLLGVIAL